MTDRISNALLAQFSEFVAAHLGLHFPPERRADLQRGIGAAAREFGYADEEACVRWLMSAPLTKLQIEVLAGNLTVGETYFFREKGAFEALEQHVLPELIRARRPGERRLRLWSTACCTGEEPYSLAILLRRLLPDLRDWNATILATDVNPRFLHKAALGVFGEWSFRDAPVWLKGDCFTPEGVKHYAILPEIRRMVTFAHLNLAQDIYPSLLNDTNAMDVILCRNVLMYFAPQQVQRVVSNLSHCLVEGGWLISSATESLSASATEFAAIYLDGTIFYRKKTRRPVPQAEWKAPPTDEPTLTSNLAEQPRCAPPPGSRSPIQLTRELANAGRLAEALTSVGQAIASEKLNPRAYYLRALILQEQGALPEAARELQRALYLDHGFILAHFALGNLARNTGRATEADKHFAHALRRLRERAPDEILPESDGLTAGRLAEIIAATMAEESAT
jgi:chemotaxis protein methyltransferase CheR